MATKKRLTALESYREHVGIADECDALERLRFFCSCAMNGQDWLDSEPFFEAVRKQIDGQASARAKR